MFFPAPDVKEIVNRVRVPSSPQATHIGQCWGAANHAIQSLETAFGSRSGPSSASCDPKDLSYALQNPTKNSGMVCMVSKVKVVFAAFCLLLDSWACHSCPSCRERS